MDICDYSKLRARLRPKSKLTMIRKEEEPRKRPLSMYAEINMEEEHAAKILRGSPPQSSTPHSRISSPPSSSFRRSHSGASEPSRSENQVRSQVKTHVPSKSTPISSFKPKPPTTPRPAQPPPQQVIPKTPTSSKTPVVSKTPDTSTNPFSSNSSLRSQLIQKHQELQGYKAVEIIYLLELTKITIYWLKQWTSIMMNLLIS